MDLNEKAGGAVTAGGPQLGGGPVHEGCDPHTEAHRGERALAVFSHVGAIHPRLGSQVDAIPPLLGRRRAAATYVDAIHPRLGSQVGAIPPFPGYGHAAATYVAATYPRLRQMPVYVDFEPRTETHEERGSRIVVLHVPGFSMENIKITSEHGNNIRVRGQQPPMNNRWSCFNQLLSVPPYSDAKEIRAKFVNQKVIITMPNKLQDIENASAENRQEMPQTDVNSTADEDEKEKNEMTLPGCTLSREVGIAKVDQRPSRPPDIAKKGGKKRSTSKEKNSTRDLDDVTAIKDVDEQISSQDEESSNNENGDHATNKTNEDDRQKFMNIGVAILALVAFGAYVGYNFGSSGTTRK